MTNIWIKCVPRSRNFQMYLSCPIKRISILLFNSTDAQKDWIPFWLYWPFLGFCEWQFRFRFETLQQSCAKMSTHFYIKSPLDPTSTRSECNTHKVLFCILILSLTSNTAWTGKTRRRITNDLALSTFSIPPEKNPFLVRGKNMIYRGLLSMLQ